MVPGLHTNNKKSTFTNQITCEYVIATEIHGWFWWKTRSIRVMKREVLYSMDYPIIKAFVLTTLLILVSISLFCIPRRFIFSILYECYRRVRDFNIAQLS